MPSLAAPVNLDLVLHPRPYQPSSFVDRVELETIRRKIRQAQTEDIIVEPVVNFWGVGGIGKTWLLRHLQHTYRYLATPSSETRTTFALYYTFDKAPSGASLPDLTKSLTKQILSQLSAILSKEDSSTLIQANNIGGDNKALINVLRKLSQRFVPLILLDDTEKIDSTNWAELEQEFIEPLVSSSRVLLVIAGRRRAPRWRRFEVRRRAMEPDETKIRPFSKDQVVKQIEQQDYQVPVDLLFSYTAGNPLLVDAITNNIGTLTKGKGADEKWLGKHKDDLLSPILQTYEEHLLENVPVHLREVLEAVSQLRSYRLEALRFMLATQNTQAETRSEGYYLSLLRDLEQQTEVVWWSHGRRAYETDSTIRRVMNRRLLLQDKEEYIKRHRQALEMYWNWARDYPEASEDFIIEIWFHLASLYQADEDQSTLQTETKQALRFAQKSLTSDRRLVLHNQLEKGDLELIELLPDNLHRTLKQLLTPDYSD